MITPREPVHPGAILKHQYLEELGITAGKLASHIYVNRARLERLVAQDTSMTVDIAIRLSRALGTTPEFWLNLQSHYDVMIAKPEDIDDIKLLVAA